MQYVNSSFVILTLTLLQHKSVPTPRQKAVSTSYLKPKLLSIRSNFGFKKMGTENQRYNI